MSCLTHSCVRKAFSQYMWPECFITSGVLGSIRGLSNQGITSKANVAFFQIYSVLTSSQKSVKPTFNCLTWRAFGVLLRLCGLILHAFIAVVKHETCSAQHCSPASYNCEGDPVGSHLGPWCQLAATIHCYLATWEAVAQMRCLWGAKDLIVNSIFTLYSPLVFRLRFCSNKGPCGAPWHACWFAHNSIITL